MWFQLLSVFCVLSLCHGYEIHEDDETRPEGRIGGGQRTKPAEFPFQIALEQKGSGIVCGGSLVTSRLVVTAAHCLLTEDGKPLSQLALRKFTVRAGEYKYSKKDGTEQLKKIKQAVVHEHYNPKTHINDIALLKLDSDFRLDEFVAPIELAFPATKYNNLNCSVSGWGYKYRLTGGAKADDPAGYSDTLRVAQVDIIDKDVCMRKNKEVKNFQAQAAHSSSLCAGKLAGGPDSCAGDSGGPLSCRDTRGGSHARVLVGIVSAGVGCRLPNSPGLYTDVSQMAGWLQQTRKTLGQSRDK